MSEAEILLDQKRKAKLIQQLAEYQTKVPPGLFDLADLETRLQLLETYWQEFSDNDLILQRKSEVLAQRAYFTNGVFEEVLKNYLDTKAWFKRQMAALQAATPRNQAAANTSTANSSGPAPVSQSSLEKLKLPSFDGKQSDWEVFKDKFTALVIDEPSMSQVVKLQRLENCLTGAAAKSLNGIRSTSENFGAAWTAVCRRYDNRHKRLGCQLDALMSLPKAEHESADHLTEIINEVAECMNVFTALGLTLANTDVFFVHMVTSKLADSTRKRWTAVLASEYNDRFPTYDYLQRFLERQIQSSLMYESADESSSDEQESEAKTRSKKKSKGGKRDSRKVSAHLTGKKSDKQSRPSLCSFCNEKHFIGFCKKFAVCSQSEKEAHVKSARLCFNCLNAGHDVASCMSKGRCLVCGAKHNTKLHGNRPASNATSTIETVPSGQSTASDVAALTARAEGCKILFTAVVTLKATNGRSMTVRALMDPGAEEAFVSERVVQALNLPRHLEHVSVTGLGCTTTAVAKSRVYLTLQSSPDFNFSRKFSALVLSKLTQATPRRQCDISPWAPFDELKLADAQWNRPGRVDCLLDAEIFACILQPGLVAGPPDTQLVAINSALGWLIVGGKGSASSAVPKPFAILHAMPEVDLAAFVQDVKGFWEMEEVPLPPAYSPAEEDCYAHFRATHTRNAEGRFVVRLPFLQKPMSMESRSAAEACLKSMERRFAKQPDVERAYREFMAEYRALGHMEPVQGEVENVSTFYIPHHPVFKQGGSNKIRVVFNASKRNADGRSLNSILHIGPKLQEDVLAIILRWSFFRFVFSCDIVKMFRQFLVDPIDRDMQRILWRDSIQEEIRAYRLNTVTYGTACAPFLSNACMLQLADDEEQHLPRAAQILRRGRYADDFFAGGDTVESAKESRDQLIKILAAAKMEVGKWASNSAELLPKIVGVDSQKDASLFEDQSVVSALGIKWDAKKDTFGFKFKQVDESHELNASSPITKRKVASNVAKLFDPIGWLAPVIIRAKVLIQNLWLIGSDWDDPIPPALEKTWIDFQSQLTDLESISIPRWVGFVEGSSWQLQCFCDASERAFAAAVYAVVTTNDKVDVMLMTAKSKVAPTKSVSLPKLELCAAVLGTRLVRYVLSKLDHQPEKVGCWSDSKVVLAWLQVHPSRWQAYIANRVSEIHTSLNDVVWRHVKSADNPADLPSRGLSVSQLRDSSLWWKGPEWLARPEAEWPHSQEIFQTEEQARAVNPVLVFAAHVDDEFGSPHISERIRACSSIEKVERIFAYVYRWRANAQLPKAKRRDAYLTTEELAKGRLFMLRFAQREVYDKELHKLQAKKVIPKSSPIARLSPYLDTDGLLRVGGRLQHAPLSESEKHPIILSSTHHVTLLLIRQMHALTLHGGPTLVQSSLFRTYWIPRCRNLIRRVLRLCVVCTRHRARTMEQLMGPLPAVRLSPARPFTYTGVDFAGPFSIKASAIRGQRSFPGYLALFICMTTKAVHLEIVSSLTSDAFLAAFRRFTSRRGLSQVMYSDHGTNFVGAANDLTRLFSEASSVSREVAAALARDRVDWRFIPPRAPHFGGLWEANVKSFKAHFKRTVGSSILSFEEFSTLAAMVEACLNSRPLSVMNASEDEYVPLTPGHFLIGSPIVVPPEPSDETDLLIACRSRWNHLVIMRNHFWKRWQKEFVSQLQQRAKWLLPNRSFEVGDVVLFKDELTPPTKWPLARITRLYPGSDGFSRVADIETAAATYTRPIHKLVLLPTNEAASAHLVRVKSGQDIPAPCTRFLLTS